ncbi:hypothetical protein D9598_09280 [Roseomonas sp. KE0001]|nr:hypothetical protein [Roseomonas sp. KE0001]
MQNGHQKFGNLTTGQWLAGIMKQTVEKVRFLIVYGCGAEGLAELARQVEVQPFYELAFQKAPA